MTAFFNWLRLLIAALLALGLLAGSIDAASRKKAPPKPELPPAFQPMRVVIVRSMILACEPLCPQWISAEGQIDARTPALFKKVLARAGKARLPIVISSPGGDVEAALAIGRMIKERQLDVAVGTTFFTGCAPAEAGCKLPEDQKGVYRGVARSEYSFCVSACPFILASGARRISVAGYDLGLHQLTRTVTQERVRYWITYRVVNGKKKILNRKVLSRKPWKSYSTNKLSKPLQKKLVAYFNKMGVDGAGMFDLINKAPASSMHLLSMEEALNVKLATEFGSPTELVANKVCASEPPAGNCIPSSGKLGQTARK